MIFPSVEEVNRIARLPDPVVRNLQITQCYHELSQAMRSLTGAGANWCTFATWASRQAGQSIRGEDLTRHVQDHLRHSPEIREATGVVLQRLLTLGMRWEAPRLLETILSSLHPATALARTSDAVALGNKKVFEEIALEFARFLAMLASEPTFDEARLEQFNAGLRPGDPPDGQNLLREAFAAYGKAFVVREPRAQSQWALLANLLIGFHEQTRLQPEIADALTVAIPIDETKRALSELLLPGVWVRLRHYTSRLFGGKSALDLLLERLLREIQQQIRYAVTQHLMSLRVSAEVLHLGTDLATGFPEALATIVNPELTQLLTRVDPTHDSVTESGAQDWAHFEDRMHFITDFFRSYHATPFLFDAPFTDEQVCELKAGRMPAGQL